MRRREMIPTSGGSGETWDYEWDYTNGISMTNDVWTLASSGSGNCELKQNGQLLASAVNGYRNVRNANFNIPIGVMEVVFYTTGIYAGAGNANTRICLGNGTKGIQISTSTGSFHLYDNNSPGNGTSLGVSVVANQLYTVRLTLNGNLGKVEIDGVTVADSVNINNILYSSNTAIWSQNADWWSTYVQSVKLKINRI